MRVITIVLESMLWDDLEGIEFPGFSKRHFDPYPATFSARSLWCMQSADPLPDMDDWHSDKHQVFAEPNRFISNYAKTRLVSASWPKRYDPKFLDPLGSIPPNSLWSEWEMEPNCPHWGYFLKFLSGQFYEEGQWRIYWPRAGHAECGRCRVAEENRGIPRGIKKTATHFAELVKTHVLPLVRSDTLVLMHTDHGTARRGQIGNYWNKGVVYLQQPMDEGVACWADIRCTIKHALGVTQLPEAGRILCG